MILLRELELRDAKFMLEWMHDVDIQKSFRRNMIDITLEEAEKFCVDSSHSNSLSQNSSIHFAIVDDADDEYLGTISLKNIDLVSMTAEYAIVLRRKAQGKGIGFIATGLLLRKAFNEYGLYRVYLNVLANNDAAVKLYEKCGFIFEGKSRDFYKIGNEYFDVQWYSMLKYEYNELLFNFGGLKCL